MNFVESLELFHVSAKEIPCLTGKGVPTVQTEGAPGVLYMDTDTGGLYKCRGGVKNGYRWELQSGGFSEDDKAEIVGTVLDVLSGKVICGYVDEENNIVINGLTAGSYTVTYEMEDGSTIDIGALEVGEAEPEEPDVPTETNYFDASTALLNHRLGSSGSPSAYDGMVVTDFIPIDSSMSGKLFTISGTTLVKSSSYGYFTRTVYYNADKSTNVTEFNHIYDGSGKYNVSPWPSNMGGITSGYLKIAMVIKDNMAITADDIANLKITLE